MFQRFYVLLISHFYNEEFLLPYWVKHHKPMFDHAVLIDYGSTDRSIEIIKDLAPDWEIRQTGNQFFEEPAIGNEVQKVEEEVGNEWKIVLNTTEFLLCPNLRAYAAEVNRPIRTNGVIIVDHPDERSIVTDEPLILQKKFGYMESDVIKKVSTTGIPKVSRSRLLHNHPHGQYTYGRHTNKITDEIDPEFLLCWFGWSPFDYVKDRKLQIQCKVSDKQKSVKQWAEVYCINSERIEAMYKEEHIRSYNLLDNKIYKAAYNVYKEFI